MRTRTLFVALVVALLVAGCFLPWITVESKGVTITGMNTTGTRFGKPGLFHLIWAGLYLVFGVINAVWSQRISLAAAAFNAAWALRNFLLLPACQMGDCPVRRAGLYVTLVASLLMFASLAFSPKTNRKTKPDSVPDEQHL